MSQDDAPGSPYPRPRRIPPPDPPPVPGNEPHLGVGIKPPGGLPPEMPPQPIPRPEPPEAPPPPPRPPPVPGRVQRRRFTVNEVGARIARAREIRAWATLVLLAAATAVFALAQHVSITSHLELVESAHRTEREHAKQMDEYRQQVKGHSMRSAQVDGATQDAVGAAEDLRKLHEELQPLVDRLQERLNKR